MGDHFSQNNKLYCSQSDAMTLPDTNHAVIKLGRSDRFLLMNLHLHHEQQHDTLLHTTGWTNDMVIKKSVANLLSEVWSYIFWRLFFIRSRMKQMCWVLVCFFLHLPLTSIHLVWRSGLKVRFGDIMTLHTFEHCAKKTLIYYRRIS